MIVFVAGMQRSGSTFSFNIVRDLLQARGSVYQDVSKSVAEIALKHKDQDHLILKSHSADDVTIHLVNLGAIPTICTVRKPEDAIASWMGTFGFNLTDSIAEMIEWIKMYNRIKHTALIIDYDDVDNHTLATARRIANFICPDATAEEIEQTAARNSKKSVMELTSQMEVDGTVVRDASFTIFHTKNYYHKRHISSLKSRRATELLDENTIRTIRNELRDYIDHDGSLAV